MISLGNTTFPQRVPSTIMFVSSPGIQENHGTPALDPWRIEAQ
jgi:hypothetical protein